MKLSTILESIKPLAINPGSDPEIKGLAYDSRQVKPGYIFFALKGRRQDGQLFIQDAVDRGAEVIVAEQAHASRASSFVGKGQAVILPTADARQAMAQIARVFYRNPAAKLKVVGITGTNGKTTTAFMIKNIFDTAGLKAGMIGTVEYIIGRRVIPATRTTPESVDLQQMLDQMAGADCRSAVMEVSSHALVQKRVGGIDFDAAVFTNLTHDHLDYHQTMEKYFQAKTLLFKSFGQSVKKPSAVVNIDDAYGRQLAHLPEIKTGLVTYGLQEPAAVRAVNLQLTAQGSVFDVASPWGGARISLRLLGRYNVANALAAFGACGALGIKPELMADVLQQMTCVPGRLEEIQTAAGFQVFVDYAHTEDALRNVLTTLREITSGRLIVVFGCGGNRDVKKRPLMGSVAEQMADYAILTSDNPRREDPALIISQILNGFKTREKVDVIPDRYEAIARALFIAEKGDVVLVAGKGHENYQEFVNTIIPFDDRQVVRECLGMKNG